MNEKGKLSPMAEHILILLGMHDLDTGRTPVLCAQPGFEGQLMASILHYISYHLERMPIMKEPTND